MQRDVGDEQYRRSWTWRVRYSTYLGGLGTGVGEGTEGVKCARGADCLAAEEVEVEWECPARGAGTGDASGSGSGSESSLAKSGHAGREDGDVVAGNVVPGTPGVDREKAETAGYWRQEIEGLGGVVKKKFRKRERVGRTVREWEEEREGKAEILAREKGGAVRSWCGWCDRVVLGPKDLESLV